MKFLKKGFFLKILKIVFLGGLFLAPFVYWPKSIIPFEIPRVWFINRWVEILILLTFFNPRAIKKRPINYLLPVLAAAFLLIASLSSLFGSNAVKSLVGNYYRSDGLLSFFHLMAFFFFLLLFWDKTWLKPTLKTIGLGSFLLSLWTIGSAFKFYVLGQLEVYSFDGAMAVSFGQPNFLAGYLLVCLPFLAFFFFDSQERKKKVFWFLALFIQVMAIALTFSQAGILGIILFILLWLILDYIPDWRQRFLKPQKLKYFSLILLLTLIVVGLFYYYQPDDSVYFPESRKRIWAKGALAFVKSPFLGWGWANFDYAFKAVDWPYPVRFDNYVDKAHSHLLEVAVTTGLLGLIFYLGIILQVIKKLFAQVKTSLTAKVLAVSFLLFLFHSQTNIISISQELIFWLILGIVSTFDKV